MLARYRAAMPGGGDRRWSAFERSFAVLAAQRHAKVIGIFTRLYRRDGKPAYLVHIPRVWRLLEGGAASTPALAPVARWFDRHLPPSQRRVPSNDSGDMSVEPSHQGRGPAAAAPGDGAGRRPRRADAPDHRAPAEAADRDRRPDDARSRPRCA